MKPGAMLWRVGIPTALLVGSMVWFITSGPEALRTPLAPFEKLYLERLVFKDEEIEIPILNTGPEAVTIGQVTVNEMLIDFSIRPSPTLPRLGRAVLTIGHSWVEGEPYEVAVITGNGFVFAQEAPVAHLTPTVTPASLGLFALLGIYVGVIPVFLGLLWKPLIAAGSRTWVSFLLSMTLGLLLFLGVDAVHEALEIAEHLAGTFQGVMLIASSALIAFMALMATSKKLTGGSDRTKVEGRLALATLIASGIGLHNLGEGLAIGASYIQGEFALGTFLVVGFALHNLTEGLGIIAPVAKDEVTVGRMIKLGAIAGGPTIIGAWLGGIAYSPVIAVLCLSIGAGAIFQVVYELGRFVAGQSGTESKGFTWSPAQVVGVAAGLVLMYVTGVLVKT